MARFTDLSRTTYEEYEQIARYAWSFFTPMKNKEMKKEWTMWINASTKTISMTEIPNSKKKVFESN